MTQLINLGQALMSAALRVAPLATRTPMATNATMATMATGTAIYGLNRMDALKDENGRYLDVPYAASGEEPSGSIAAKEIANQSSNSIKHDNEKNSGIYRGGTRPQDRPKKPEGTLPGWDKTETVDVSAESKGPTILTRPLPVVGSSSTPPFGGGSSDDLNGRNEHVNIPVDITSSSIMHSENSKRSEDDPSPQSTSNGRSLETHPEFGPSEQNLQKERDGAPSLTPEQAKTLRTAEAAAGKRIGLSEYVPLSTLNDPETNVIVVSPKHSTISNQAENVTNLSLEDIKKQMQDGTGLWSPENIEASIESEKPYVFVCNTGRGAHEAKEAMNELLAKDYPSQTSTEAINAGSVLMYPHEVIPGKEDAYPTIKYKK